MKQWIVICDSKILKTLKLLENVDLKKKKFFPMLSFSFFLFLKLTAAKCFRFQPKAKWCLINGASAHENESCQTIQTILFQKWFFFSSETKSKLLRDVFYSRSLSFKPLEWIKKIFTKTSSMNSLAREAEISW